MQNTVPPPLNSQNQSQSSRIDREIRKCPACGAIVPTFKGVCQECGYEFTNVSVNSSSIQFASILSSKKLRMDGKIRAIEAFPVPLSKAELLDFIIQIKNHLLEKSSDAIGFNEWSDEDGYYAGKLTSALLIKYNQCIEKAKVAYAGDAQLQPFIDEYSEIIKAVDKNKMQSRIKTVLKWLWNHKIVSAIIIIVIGMTIHDVFFVKSDSKIQDIRTEYQTAISNDKLDKAMDLLTKYDDVLYAKPLVEAYLAKGDISGAITVYTNDGKPEDCKELIYKGLIESKRFDEAWNYHYQEKKYDSDSQDICNADHYYQYVMDVVEFLCKSGDKTAARDFVKDKSTWFFKNVDSYTGSNYESHVQTYSSKVVVKNLNNFINQY